MSALSTENTYVQSKDAKSTAIMMKALRPPNVSAVKDNKDMGQIGMYKSADKRDLWVVCEIMGILSMEYDYLVQAYFCVNSYLFKASALYDSSRFRVRSIVLTLILFIYKTNSKCIKITLSYHIILWSHAFLPLNWNSVGWFLGNGWTCLGFGVGFFFILFLSWRSSLSSYSTKLSVTTCLMIFSCSYLLRITYYKNTYGISFLKISITSWLKLFLPYYFILFDVSNFLTTLLYWFYSITSFTASILSYRNYAILFLFTFKIPSLRSQSFSYISAVKYRRIFYRRIEDD